MTHRQWIHLNHDSFTCSHVQAQTDTCRHMQAQSIHRFVCFIEKVLFSHSSIHSANFQRNYNLCYLYLYYLTIGPCVSVFLNKHIILFRVDTQRHMQAQTESRILLITLGTHKHVYRLGKITLFVLLYYWKITLGCTHVCEVGSCTVSDSDVPSHVGLQSKSYIIYLKIIII